MLEDAKRQHIVIVGGGVIGLSIAISLLDHQVQPYAVTVIAEDLPDLDQRTYTPNGHDGSQAAPAAYASAWAGAHHVSDALSEVGQRRDRTTFETLCKLDAAMKDTQWASDDATPFCWSHQLEFWSKGAPNNAKSVEWYPDYRVIDGSAAGEVDFACAFTTLNFVVPRYLSMLYAYMLALGGRALRQKVSSLEEAVQLATAGSNASGAAQYVSVNKHGKVERHSIELGPPALVVATPGLGAKDLLRDDNVLPLRGQTLLVRAPWCSAEAVSPKLAPLYAIGSREDSPHEVVSATYHAFCGVSRVKAERNGTGFRDTYVIPRGDGTFIVGGTRLANDWDTRPRSETTEEILARVLPLIPALVKPGERDCLAACLGEKSGETSPRRLSSLVDIIDTNVGLRPARHSGIRIERASVADEKHLLGQAHLPLIYSYGYGGTGYQTSWGAAFDTRDLVDEALEHRAAPIGSTWRQLEDGNLQLPDPSWLTRNAALARS